MVLFQSRKRPPAMRMRSRPEISCLSMVKSGAVRPTSQDRTSSNPIRMNIARKRPIFRAISRRAAGSRSTRIEMKMTLSIPNTSSSTVNVTNAIQASGLTRRSSIGALSDRNAQRLPGADEDPIQDRREQQPFDGVIHVLVAAFQRLARIAQVIREPEDPVQQPDLVAGDVLGLARAHERALHPVIELADQRIGQRP